jgi:hypothetical protein
MHLLSDSACVFAYLITLLQYQFIFVYFQDTTVREVVNMAVDAFSLAESAS